MFDDEFEFCVFICMFDDEFDCVFDDEFWFCCMFDDDLLCDLLCCLFCVGGIVDVIVYRVENNKILSELEE